MGGAKTTGFQPAVPSYSPATPPVDAGLGAVGTEQKNKRCSFSLPPLFALGVVAALAPVPRLSGRSHPVQGLSRPPPSCGRAAQRLVSDQYEAPHARLRRRRPVRDRRIVLIRRAAPGRVRLPFPSPLHRPRPARGLIRPDV